MSVRIAALGAAALLVLVVGVYLFHEVRTSPAAAEGSSGSGPGPRPEARVERPRPPSSDLDAPRAPRQPVELSTSPPREGVRDPAPVLEPGADDPAGPPKNLAFDQHADAVMSEANKAYDRGDFDDAKAFAQKVLADKPGNVRMLRILVSASCIDGDSVEAQKRYLQLPPADRAQMRTRCDRYGVTLTEK